MAKLGKISSEARLTLTNRLNALKSELAQATRVAHALEEAKDDITARWQKAVETVNYLQKERETILLDMKKQLELDEQPE